jgi:hypothetical protein
MNASNSGGTEVSTLTYRSGLSIQAGATIAVRWGARRSASFANPMTFEWSPDGTSWQQVSYAEVPNTTTWMRVNNGDEILITMPPAGGAALAFRWTFTQANNGAAYRLDDFEIAGTVISGVTASQDPLPTRLELLPNYPNPFNSSTTVVFRIDRRGEVSLDVFDVLGRRVGALLNGPLDAGEHRVPVNMSGCSSGTYVVRLAVSGDVATSRILLVR